MLDDPSLPQVKRLSTSELEDEVPAMLDRMIAALDNPRLGDVVFEARKLAESHLPRDHARVRVRQGFTISDAMRELSLLRRCIVEAYRDEPDVEPEAVRFLHTALDHCMSVSATEMERTNARRLEEIAEMRERFVAIVGHDLRNPLNAIKMAGAILRKMDLPEAARAFLVRIVRSADRMAEMINELLDFAALRSGALKINRKHADLRDVCNEVADELRIVHPEREIEIDARGDLEGEWDVARMSQVASNLIANAVSYSPKGTPVSVTLSGGDDDDVIIDVHNEGPPIPEAERERIFEPFHRGEGEQRDVKGVGLGLFIAREMVLAHGGSIAIRSNEREGTTFSLHVPRHAA